MHLLAAQPEHLPGAGVELVGEDFGVEEGDGDGDGLGKVFGGGGGAELLVL